MTFFINGNPAFTSGPISLPRDSPDCTILDSWVFDSLILLINYLQKIYEDLWPVY